MVRATARALLHRLPPASRATVVRDAVPVEDLLGNLPKTLLQDLLFGAATSLGVTAIRVNGQLGEIEGSPRDRVILYRYLQTGTWSSRFQREIIDKVFALGEGTYIDVGANIGLTSIPVAAKWGVQCYAFEPDPTNFRFLQRNTELNDVGETIQLFNIAVHEREATLDFELSPENLGDHRIRSSTGAPAIAPKQNENKRHVIKVAAAPLDATLSGANIKHPLVLKIDVQGAEPAVFRGARKLLYEADCLVVEFSPYALARAGADEDDFFRELHGFTCGFIASFDGDDQDSNRALINPLPLADVIAKCRDASWHKHPDNYFDLILLRREDFFRAGS